MATSEAKAKVGTALQTSLAKINAGIKAVKTGYANTHKKVQEVGILIIQHAQEHGDCDRAKALARAVPARERNSLVGWFRMFSPIGVQIGNSPKEDKARFIKPESNLYRPFNVAGAKANNWWDDPAKVNAPPAPLLMGADFFAQMERFIDRTIKIATEGRGKEKKPVYNKDAAELVAKDGPVILNFIRKLRAKELGSQEASDAEAKANGQKPIVKRPQTRARSVGNRQAANEGEGKAPRSGTNG